MAEPNVLALARTECKQGDLDSASRRLAVIIRAKFQLDVLRVEDGRIVDIIAFGSSLFAAFGLPPTL